MRGLPSTLRALTILIFAACSAWAQFDTATVLGTLRDASGAVITDGKVTLESRQTGVVSATTTDGNGNYEFFNVRIGSYVVRAEATGFQTTVTDPFTVTVSARQRVDLTMQVGQTTENVTVSDAVTPLETESSDRGQVVRTAAIVNLPLNGRAYADLALLAPGVRRSTLNATQAVSSRDASFNVNGLRSSLNNFLLDGVDNNAYGTSNQGFSNQVVQITPDAVAEFRIQTNNYSAEYGRAGGAIINAALRSGTNAFHGAAWEFLRNTELNAVGFFAPAGGVKPVFIQNQFGAAIGGPIKKDQMFFFADYEGLRRVARTRTTATLPTQEQRQGVFRNADGSPISIRNPYTGEVYSNGIIPASQISAFARGVLGDLPAPNLAGTGANFELLPRASINDDKGDIRYDHYLTQRITAFVRYSHRLANIFEPSNVPGPSGGNANGNTRVLNQQIAPGVNVTIDSRSVLEARVGVSLTEGGKTPIGVGLPSLQERFGIGGLPTREDIAGGLNTQVISGYSDLGRQPSNPQFQNPYVVNPKVNYSRVLGRHSVKTGYEHQRIDTELDDFNPKYGRDAYSGQFSRPAGAGSASGTLAQVYNLADFLFGARSQYELNNETIVNYRQRMHFAYVQDDWKVNSRLTLNLGVRYEFATPQYERDNRLVNFDPTGSGSLLMASDGSLEERALVRPDRNNWAPRIGLAYTLLPKTVVRSGYGISYIHFNRLGGENILAFNGPNIVGATVVQTPASPPQGTGGQPLCGPNDAPLTCFRPTQLGYPANFAVPAAFNPLTARVNYIPRDTRTGYVQSWHFTVQQELARDLVLDVAYVGNRGVNLTILGDFNQAVPNGPGQNLSLQARRPYQRFSFVQAAFDGGFSNYHSLQAKLEKRFSNGLFFLHSFTWSKAIDNASGHLETASGDNSRVNIRDLSYEKGLSGYNQPLNNTTSLVWDLPYGKGRRFGTDAAPLLEGVLGGWRLNVIHTATSGIPINVSYNPTNQQQVSTVLTLRPDLTCSEVVTPEGQRTVNNYLNRACFAVPDATRPFGSAGRNIARGPDFQQLDLSLHKQFGLWAEATRLEFRAEAFNALNRTNFQPPAANISANTFGQITATFPPRQLQFALKLLF